MAGVGGLELANVGFLKSQPNSLVSWKIFVPETFRGGCEEGGYAIDPGAEPGIGRAILIGAALPSRRSAKLKCRSPAGRALGRAILIYLAIASSPVTAQDAQPGRALLLKWLLLPELVPWPVSVSHRTWKAFTRLRSRGLSNHHSRTKRLSQKKRRSNVVEIVSGLADGAGSMPAKWSRRVFWLRSYEGKISCESFELASRLCGAVALKPGPDHLLGPPIGNWSPGFSRKKAHAAVETPPRWSDRGVGRALADVHLTEIGAEVLKHLRIDGLDALRGHIPARDAI